MLCDSRLQALDDENDKNIVTEMDNTVGNVFVDSSKPTIEVLLPQGFGFGHGAISVTSQLQSGELTQESLSAAVEIVCGDNSVFVKTDSDPNDDGCGDGRVTGKVYRVVDPIANKIENYTLFIPRAKIFGGGLVTASSMWRAVDGRSDYATLQGDREFVADLLESHNIHHGAHTAQGHGAGGACGCGAIDNYQEITRNSTRYREDISNILRGLYGADYTANVDAIERVLDTYSTLSDQYFAGTDGAQTMRYIESHGAVIKELVGEHKEDLVVINDVEGTTFDQEQLRKKLIERGLSPEIQAFVVDLWRGRMYADFIADRAAEIGHDREDSFKLAFADFLIRTLSVSATLTAGDQPVILRSKT